MGNIQAAYKVLVLLMDQGKFEHSWTPAIYNFDVAVLFNQDDKESTYYKGKSGFVCEA